MDLYERSTRRPGAKVYRWWWEQAGIDLEGVKKRTAETRTISESKSEEESDVESIEDSGREEESQGASNSSGA